MSETTQQERPSADARIQRHGQTALRWFTTTDHKVIGSVNLVTTFCFFLVGGVFTLPAPCCCSRSWRCRASSPTGGIRGGQPSQVMPAEALHPEGPPQDRDDQPSGG